MYRAPPRIPADKDGVEVFWLFHGFLQNFRDSGRELRKLDTVVLCGLLTALQIISQYFEIRLLLELRISFEFLFLSACGMLFGPVVCAVQGVAADLLGFMLRPDGAFFPGYTLSALVAGLVYGSFFYHKRLTWQRALGGKLVVNLFVNMGLNSVWSYLLYNVAFWAHLIRSTQKNLLLLFVEVPLLLLVHQIVHRVQRHRRR